MITSHRITDFPKPSQSFFSSSTRNTRTGVRLIIPSVHTRAASVYEIRDHLEKAAGELKELKTMAVIPETDWANVITGTLNALRMIGTEKASTDLLDGVKDLLETLFDSHHLTCKQKSTSQTSVRNICVEYAPKLDSVLSISGMNIDYDYPELITLPTPLSAVSALKQNTGFEDEVVVPLYMMSDSSEANQFARPSPSSGAFDKRPTIKENTTLIAAMTGQKKLEERERYHGSPFDTVETKAQSNRIENEPSITTKDHEFDSEAVSKKMQSLDDVKSFLEIIDVLSLFAAKKIDTDHAHNHIHIGFDNYLLDTLKAGLGEGIYERYARDLYMATDSRTRQMINSMTGFKDMTAEGIQRQIKKSQDIVLKLQVMQMFKYHYTNGFAELNCVSDMPDGLNWELFKGETPAKKRETYMAQALLSLDEFIQRYAATKSSPAVVPTDRNDYMLQNRRYNPLNIHNHRNSMENPDGNKPTLEVRNLEYHAQENMNASSDMDKAQLKYIMTLMDIAIQEVIGMAQATSDSPPTDLTPKQEQAVIDYQHDMTLAAFHSGLTQLDRNDRAVELLNDCLKENPNHREGLQHPNDSYPMLHLLTKDDFINIIKDTGEENPIVLYRLSQMDSKAKEALHAHLRTMNDGGQFDKWIEALNCNSVQEISETLGKLGIFP